jgi:ATP-dependent Lhr-like helicase
MRNDDGPRAAAEGTVVVESEGTKVWWTWAGERANATLAAAMSEVIDADDLDNHHVRLRDDVSREPLHQARKRAQKVDLPAPTVTDEASSN